MTWRDWINIAHLVVTLLIFPLLSWIRAILAEVRKTNGRLTALEKWQGVHEKLDDSRFEMLQHAIDSHITKSSE